MRRPSKLLWVEDDLPTREGRPIRSTLPTRQGALQPWRLFVPKLVTVLREGYGLAELRRDALAGLTVAIVALPLAMALAIASGTTPEKGLVTVVVAGLLISALGGSRVQIGGPTGAFVVVVFDVIARHGYDGLLLATLMAGIMLIIAGAARLGTWIKYIPEPVVTGFTAGIAVIIFTSQVQEFLGLTPASVPGDVAGKWLAFAGAWDTLDPIVLLVSALALATILVVRRYRPKLPAFLVAVTLAAVLVALFGLPVATIETRFGGIPSSFPAPGLPAMSFERLWQLVPSAFTIAFLAGVESLLSAVVADGMTGGRHRSNCELVAQGVANTASALFGGLPATGAIARTATNVRSGGRSPVAGILHAVFVLAFMLVAAPLAGFIPLASLAAVLVIVAWNMAEIDRFRRLLNAPWGDRITLLVTFALTVLVDLTVAIEVGVVLGAILFMHRMSEVVAVTEGAAPIIEEDVDDVLRPRNGDQRTDLPPGVEVFQFRGPLFFGAASSLADVTDRLGRAPKVFVLRLREVPMMDVSGASSLRDLVDFLRRHGTEVILSGVQPQPARLLAQTGLLERPGLHVEKDFPAALERAREIVGTE